MPTAAFEKLQNLKEHQDAVFAALEHKPGTFSAFEGNINGDVIKGVSLIQEGPALTHTHHGFQIVVDQEALRRFERIAKKQRRVKVKFNHNGVIQDAVGYASNFRIEGKKLVGDVTLFKAHPSKELLLEMADSISDSFGISLMFTHGEHVWDEATETFAVRPISIFSADFVDVPAANPTGLFEAEIDKQQNDMPAISVEAFDAYKSEAAAAYGGLAEQLSALNAKLAELQTSLESKKEDPAPPPAEEPKPFEQFDAKLEALKETLLKAFAAAPKASDQQAAPANDQQDADPLLITRAQFEAIHPNQRGAFFAKGGKIKA